MKQRKSWKDKLLDSKDLPKVVELTGRWREKWGQGTLVIPAPVEVDEVMRKAPKGKLVTINEVRAILAAKHKTTMACPVTTGIFAWIAAHAAEEAISEGRTRITPYWRVLKSGGQLNEKYPGGIGALKKRLEAEGHKVVNKGKNYVVADFEKSLASLS